MSWHDWFWRKVLLPAVRQACPGLDLEQRPTAALPGSEEKIRVLAERVHRGQALHQPGDARLDDRDGYLPQAWGGEWLAGALCREEPDGVLELTEERTRQKRGRSPGEVAQRQSEEASRRERQRGRRRRADRRTRNQHLRADG